MSVLGTDVVTDGGLETDLIFRRGWNLPLFAAFPLLDDAGGRQVLRDYYADYVAIAVAAGVPLLLETPTWRANAEWGAAVGYAAGAVDRVNREAVDWLQRLAGESTGLPGWQVSGTVGPLGDGYDAGTPRSAEQFASVHGPQLAAFRAAGADRAGALTMTTIAEALGVAWAAAGVGLPVSIGFTVETDGRLPGGTPLDEAVGAVDADAEATYFVVNCAHPEHIAEALDGGAWQARIGGLRVNASRLSHAQLDESDTLDDGDPTELAANTATLRQAFPNAAVIGGCCGTDARHVAAMWDVTL